MMCSNTGMFFKHINGRKLSIYTKHKANFQASRMYLNSRIYLCQENKFYQRFSRSSVHKAEWFKKKKLAKIKIDN